jgi:hypothetical protein
MMPGDVSNPGRSCNFGRLWFPDLHWTRLNRGDRLGRFDVISTCKSSSVIVKANLPFNHPTFQWEERHGEHWARVPSEEIVAIRTLGGEKNQAEIEVEVIEVSGEAYYSTDRDLIEKHNFLRVGSGKSPGEIEKEETQRDSDLYAIGWERLTTDRLLGPWDMIWTQKDSRVEIEILKDGPYIFMDGSTDVRDSAGRFTKKKRFPGKSYFIMDPTDYLSARVNKIIGEVWIAKDRGKVREFFKKYRTPAALREAMDAEADRRWQEMLWKQELE